MAGKVGRREIYPPVPQLPSPLIRTLSMASSVSVLTGLTQLRIQAIKAAPPPPLSQGLDDRPPPPPYLKAWIHYCDCTKSYLYSFFFLASCDDDLRVKLESPVLN